jgi:protein-S-isoprenylcysteine O-methyltransferase Ste14
VGNGIVLPSLIRAALLRVQPRQAGVASGALTTAQQFAGSAGVVLLGVVFFALAGSHPVARTYSTAMAWTTGINVLLVLAVVWASLTFKRIADSTSTGS